MQGRRAHPASISHEGHGHGDEDAELAFIEFAGADRLLQGATNARFRNHLSLIKDAVPDAGRNPRVLDSVEF